MPTTQVTEITASIDAIAARTNSSGGAVSPDWAAEERRMDHEIQEPGIMKPTDAYKVVAGAGATMNIIVGSGTAKTDLALVQGDIAGQGKYLVRFDEVTKTIALDAADPSDPRIDEVYLVVYDNIYDATSRSLPRFVVRKGDAAASPSAPGPDAAWEAFLLLSEITIPAAAADILAATFVDKRVTGGLVHTAASHTDQGATGAELETLTDGSNADALHGHDHGSTTGKGDDDHSQYQNVARHNAAHGAIIAERTTNQSIPDNTPTTVVYDTIIREDDEDGDFTYGTGTGILTINNAGWYHIVAGVRWTGGTQNPFMGIYLNGPVVGIAFSNCDNADSRGGTVAIIKYLAATNTIRILVEQNAGGSANISGVEESFFSAVKLRE